MDHGLVAQKKINGVYGFFFLPQSEVEEILAQRDA